MKYLFYNHTIKILFIFLFLGVFFHWFPNLGTPLHSDVSWMFRLQTAKNENLNSALPVSLREIGAYPNNIVTACRNWHEFTGRFNCADIAAFRVTARFAGNNADSWRLIYILFLGSAVGLFYLICRKLNMPKLLAFLLSLPLFFAPLDIWTDHKTSEPRAIFFLMLSLYLAIGSQKKYITLILSALSMLLAVLTKETFALAWILVPVMILWNNYKIGIRNKKELLYSTFRKIIPHLYALAFLVIFVIYLKISAPLKTAGYVFSPTKNDMTIFSFFGTYFFQLLPLIAQRLWQPLIFFMIASILWIWKYKKDSLKKFLKSYVSTPIVLLILGIVGVIILHGFAHFFTNRPLDGGRYMLPASWLFLLLIGVVLTPFYYHIFLPILKKSWKFTLAITIFLFLWPFQGYTRLTINVFVILLLALASFIYFNRTKFPSNIIWKNLIVIGITAAIILPHIDRILYDSVKKRVDHSAWQSLVHDVAVQTPDNGHVVLLFDEPYMVESASSLEANTLLMGRYDITYHLIIEDETIYEKDTGFLKYNVDTFNKERVEIPSGEYGNILYVRADRKRKKGNNAKIGNIELLKKIFTSPKDFFIYRYKLDRPPYLNYQLSQNKL